MKFNYGIQCFRSINALHTYAYDLFLSKLMDVDNYHRHYKHFPNATIYNQLEQNLSMTSELTKEPETPKWVNFIISCIKKSKHQKRNA